MSYLFIVYSLFLRALDVILYYHQVATQHNNKH